jgi:AmmeMemoRadiSam system protein B
VLNIKSRAIISPHAGYVYSGFTANIAHRILANSNLKRVVVIGPSHKVYLKGISGSFYDSYETPCGDLEIDKEYLENLSKDFNISFIPEAHKEHSTETQMPFIKHYLPDVKVVELVYGDISPDVLANICKIVLQEPKSAVVISTDLSHFYPKKEAQIKDSYCLRAVDELDISLLHSGCEACGKIGMEAMILAALDLRLKPRILDYRTSADASGDESSVVGYMSAIFI